jgi:glyoxylase I family protein
MSIERVHHIALICSEKERALQFYVQGLGFEIVRSHVRPEHHDEIVMLQGHGVVLEMFVDATHPPRVTGPEALGLRHLAFLVDDVEAVAAHMRDCGFAPEPLRTDSFDGRKMTFVKDPDGLPIELHE